MLQTYTCRSVSGETRDKWNFVVVVVVEGVTGFPVLHLDLFVITQSVI